MITSSGNSHIKAVRKLAESKTRSLTGNFLAEGLRVVGQAFDSGAEILELIISPELLISEYGKDMVQKAAKDRSNPIPITEVSAEVFVSLARKDKPQGIAAVIRQSWREITAFNNLESGILVALESVQNPGNLGTILRTCDAVGARGAILLDNSTDPYDPAAVKASMGSIFTVPVVRANLEQLEQLQRDNPKLAFVGSSDKAQTDFFESEYPDPIVLMLGSEREGLSEEYAKLCQTMVSIPMLGSCDSLNLSVAAGILLYQIYYHHKRNL